MFEHALSRRELLHSGLGAGAVAALGGGGEARSAAMRENGLAWLDVRDLGAQGDGVADDRVAFVTAANRAAAAGGPATIYVPAGVYLIGEGPPPELGDDVTIVGEGARSVLKRAPRSTYLGLLVNRDYIANTRGARNIAILNLSFDDSGPDQNPPYNEFKHCVAFIGVHNATIRGCRFFNLSGDGVYVSSTIDATERDNHCTAIRIVENHFDGGNQGRNGISVIDASDVVIADNTFVGVASDIQPGGVDLEPNLPGQDILNVTVIGNTFQDCRQGIQAYGAIEEATGVKRGLTITGNAVTGSRDQGMGIRVSAWESVSVGSNIVSDTANAGIFIEDVDQGVVLGNSVRNAGTERTAAGIWVREAPRAVVGGNSVGDVSGDGVRVDRCQMFSLTGNTIRGWGTGDRDAAAVRGVRDSVGGIVSGNTVDGEGRDRTRAVATDRGCSDWNIADNLLRNVDTKFRLSGRNRAREEEN